MRILAFDTSSAHCSVAVSVDGAERYRKAVPQARGQSEVLHELIAEALSELKMNFAALDAFVVARGPGSFTGMRIGLAAAAGFQFATQKPACGFSTLQALASLCANPAALPVLAAEPSGKGGFQAGLYGADMTPLLAPREVMSLAELPLPASYAKIGGAFQDAPAPENLASGLLRLAERFRGDAAYADLSPLYLRDADVTLSA